MSYLSIILVLVSVPVIELDEMYIEGKIRKPALIELKKSNLTTKIEQAAVSNLVRLERKLTEPLLVKEFRRLVLKSKL